jgi:hypothetical protein
VRHGGTPRRNAGLRGGGVRTELRWRGSGGCIFKQNTRIAFRVRIPLILISHSGRSRSPIPVILITLFTMPEEGTADSMTWRWTATTDG